MASDALLQEWLRSSDIGDGGAYLVSRYGEGAAGNPVFGYDRETVQALIDQSTKRLADRIAKLEVALAEIAEADEPGTPMWIPTAAREALARPTGEEQP